jgi:hypothetical protein
MAGGFGFSSKAQGTSKPSFANKNIKYISITFYAALPLRKDSLSLSLYVLMLIIYYSFQD